MTNTLSGYAADITSFDETRWEHATPEQKAAHLPFSIGPRGCMGIHLARMELRLALAVFFRECKGAKLSSSMSVDMMEPYAQFLNTPKSGKCLVNISPEQ